MIVVSSIAVFRIVFVPEIAQCFSGAVLGFPREGYSPEKTRLRGVGWELSKRTGGQD